MCFFELPALCELIAIASGLGFLYPLDGGAGGRFAGAGLVGCCAAQGEGFALLAAAAGGAWRSFFCKIASLLGGHLVFGDWVVA